MTKMIAIHPGEILREEFLAPLGISAYRLAKELHIPAPRVHDIVLEKRGISADTALRLGRYFNLPAKFWMGLQSEYELRLAMNAANIEGIVPRDAAQLKEAS